MIIKWGYHLENSAVEAIKKRFQIPAYTTINGLTPVEIAEEEMEIFEETARRGFFTIFHKKWSKKGALYFF